MHDVVSLAGHVVSLDLPTGLDIDEHEVATFSADELDVADDRVGLGEAEQLFHLALLHLVHPDLADPIHHVLHVDQVFTVKVKRDMILREAQVLRVVLHEHVFFEVTDADRVEVGELGFGGWVAWNVNRHHAVEVLVEQCD